jgi:hypothetical protein
MDLRDRFFIMIGSILSGPGDLRMGSFRMISLISCGEVRSFLRSFFGMGCCWVMTSSIDSVIRVCCGVGLWMGWWMSLYVSASNWAFSSSVK